MMTNSYCRFAASLAVVLCCACNPTQLVGSKFVKSQDVTASQGGTLTVASSDSPELAGTTLVIEPGALATDTKITLELGEKSITSGTDKSAGQIAIWGPGGTQFTKPAKMTIPYELQAGESIDRLFIQVEEDNGERFVIDRSSLTIDETAKTVTFLVNGFTGFQPGTNTPCMANNDCAMGQACVNGVCKATGCSGAPNQQCQCNSNSECAMGQVCSNGLCQSCTTASCTGACSNINQCPMGQACLNGQCTVCTNGACTSSCSPNAPCSNGQVCLNGVCVAPSCGPMGCPSGTQCSAAGVCVPVQNGCGAMGQTCPMGQVCLNGMCAPQNNNCGPNAPCPMGQTCTANGTCSACNAMTGCPQCDAQTPCASGQVCVNGTCRACSAGSCAQCMTNLDCPSGQACISGQCRATMTQCGPNAPCPMGMTCTAAGTCAASNACNSGMGCPNGQACQNGVCVVPNDGGTNDGGMPVQCGGVICQMGRVCIMNQCMLPPNDGGTNDGGTRPDGGTCNPMTQNCNPNDGGSPDAGAQCGGVVCSMGRVCIMNQCMFPPADGGGGMSDGGTNGGNDGGFIQMCNATMQCASGQQCVNGICQ